MPGQDQTDPTSEFAKELARQLPVKAMYDDVASPAAKQTGQILTDIVKTIQLALAPLQFFSAYQDRLRKFIDTSVRRVAPEQRISPDYRFLVLSLKEYGMSLRERQLMTCSPNCSVAPWTATVLTKHIQPIQ
jgi:hypothetical protein